VSHPITPLIASVENEFKTLDDIILTRIASKVGLAEEISAYLVNAGGKRVRPLLTLLALKALGKEDERGTLLAASIEFLHTATLLHDDVVDESEQRRGRDTANQVWGNAPSVLAGDFVYTRAFQLMVDVGDMRILKELADTTNTIAEGELQQLINKGDVDVDETAYFDVIYAKTARLFEAAGRVAGLLADASDAQIQGLAEYGRLIGLAFQIADDALDYQRDANSGKSLGDDLAEGKITLPILIARDALPADQARWLDMQFTRANGDALDEVIEKLESTQALERTLERAENLADQAIAELASLPDSEFKAHLVTLAHIAARRNS
jgi:octaprenyl-diphosphate synthase